MPDQPWHELPPEIVNVLRPALADVANEMIQAVATVPAYSRPLEGPFGEGIRAGVQEALRHFLAEVQAGGEVTRPDVYSTLGRGEMRAGRSLDSLLSAYRIGARVAWRRFAAAGVDAGLEPETLYLLAESIFAYIDVLSAESAEGYALEQSAAASEAELRRRRLVRLLVRDPPADPDAIEAAAADAGWPLPRTLAVVAIGGEQRGVRGLPAARRFDQRGVRRPHLRARGRSRRTRAAGGDRAGGAGAGASGGLGTTVDWTQARISFARARAALELADRAGRRWWSARERAGELLLRADPRLAEELAADRLAPLAGALAGLASAADRDAGRCGWPSRGASGRSPSAWGSTRRRRATGWGACASCSATSLDEPDGRFWLELALRAQDPAAG